MQPIYFSKTRSAGAFYLSMYFMIIVKSVMVREFTVDEVSYVFLKI